MIHSTGQPESKQIDVFNIVGLSRLDGDGHLCHTEPIHQILFDLLAVNEAGVALVFPGALDLNENDRADRGRSLSPRRAQLLCGPAPRACRGLASARPATIFWPEVAMFSGSLIISSSSSSAPLTRETTLASRCGVADSSTMTDGFESFDRMPRLIARGLVPLVQDDSRPAQTDQIADRRGHEVPTGFRIIFNHRRGSGFVPSAPVRRHVVLRRKVLHDVSAAVAEELQLFLGFAIRAGQLHDQDVQAIAQADG